MKKPLFVRLSDAALEHLARSVEYLRSRGQAGLNRGDLIEQLIASAPVSDETAAAVPAALPRPPTEIAYASLTTGGALSREQWQDLARLVAQAYRHHTGIVAADLLVNSVRAFLSVRALRPLASHRPDAQDLVRLDVRYLGHLVCQDDEATTLDDRIRRSVDLSCERYVLPDFVGRVDAPGELLSLALDGEPRVDDASLDAALRPHLGGLLRVALSEQTQRTGRRFGPATPPPQASEAYWSTTRTGVISRLDDAISIVWIVDSVSAGLRLHIRAIDSETVIEAAHFSAVMDVLRVIDRACSAPHALGLERGRCAYAPWSEVAPMRPHSFLFDGWLRINLTREHFAELGSAARELLTAREIIGARERLGYVWGDI